MLSIDGPSIVNHTRLAIGEGFYIQSWTCNPIIHLPQRQYWQYDFPPTPCLHRLNCRFYLALCLISTNFAHPVLLDKASKTRPNWTRQVREMKLAVVVKGWAYRVLGGQRVGQSVPGDQGVGLQGPKWSRGRHRWSQRVKGLGHQYPRGSTHFMQIFGQTLMVMLHFTFLGPRGPLIEPSSVHPSTRPQKFFLSS